MHCGKEFGWKKLTRNVLVDLQKGLHVLKKTTAKMFRSKYKVVYSHFQNTYFVYGKNLILIIH